MAYVVSQLWIWLLGAFVVGALTAILVRQPEEKRWIAGWMLWACLALLAASAVAGVGALAGRAALYVESGVASFATFLLGGVFGTRFTSGSLREHRGWALGLGPLALIWLGVCFFATAGLEADLKQRIGRAIEGGDLMKFEVEGRDILLPQDVADRAKLVDKILDVNGVRLVADGGDGKYRALAESPERAPAPDARANAAAPAEKSAQPAFRGESEAPRVIASIPQTQVAAVVNAPSGRKEGLVQTASRDENLSANLASAADRAKAAAAVLAKVPAAGELDAETCQAALSATVTLEKIEFGNASAKIRFVAGPILDKIAALLKRCQGVRVEIGVHMDAGGAANQKLSQQRAEKLISYLEREGVARGLLRGVGYGANKPIASDDTIEGRAQNRRVEFVVR
jgi:outer membrane protein OmpA-like peptidoglycan-associated protein